jgi:FkbM family methyltransferase
VNRSPALAAKRTMQTVRDFDNGYRVLGSLVSGRLTGHPADLRVRARGLTLTTPNRAGARVPLYEILAEDSYRLPWFTAGLSPTAGVLDIGAHVGSFSVWLSHLCPQLRVAAFEPIPSTFSYLQRNLDTNGAAGRVTAYNVAVSATDGRLRVGDHGAARGDNGVAVLDQPGAMTVEVSCISLASAMELVEAPVELVKIDCEGAEYDIVLRSDPAQWESVRRVAMEFHEMPGHSWEELRTFFAAAGLTEVLREPASGPLGVAWLSRDPLPTP